CKCFKIKSSPTCGRVAQLGEHLLCKQGVRGSNPLTSTNLINQLGAAAFSGRGDCAQFCAPLPTETDCEIAVSIKAIGAFRPDDSAAAAIAEVVLKLVGSCVDIGPMPPALLRRFLLFLNSIPQQCDDDVYVSARIREQGFSSFGVEKFQMHGAFGCGS